MVMLGESRAALLLRVVLPIPCVVSGLVLSAVQVSGGVQSLGGDPNLVISVMLRVARPRCTSVGKVLSGSGGEGPLLP